jgi:hypothetical protein
METMMEMMRKNRRLEKRIVFFHVSLLTHHE